jgi:hypothetical protein
LCRVRVSGDGGGGGSLQNERRRYVLESRQAWLRLRHSLSGPHCNVSVVTEAGPGNKIRMYSIRVACVGVVEEEGLGMRVGRRSFTA